MTLSIIINLIIRTCASLCIFVLLCYCVCVYVCVVANCCQISIIRKFKSLGRVNNTDSDT